MAQLASSRAISYGLADSGGALRKDSTSALTLVSMGSSEEEGPAGSVGQAGTYTVPQLHGTGAASGQQREPLNPRIPRGAKPLDMASPFVKCDCLDHSRRGGAAAGIDQAAAGLGPSHHVAGAVRTRTGKG